MNYQATRFRIEIQEFLGIPAAKELAEVTNLARQYPGRVVILPWSDERSSISYQLHVFVSESGTDPQWMLNNGPSSTALFTITSVDVGLIGNLINSVLTRELYSNSPDRIDGPPGPPTKPEDTSEVLASRAQNPKSSWLHLRTVGVEESQRQTIPPGSVLRWKKPDGGTAEVSAAGGGTKQTSSSERNATNIMTGDLLIGAGLIDLAQLSKCLLASKANGLPLGQVLVTAGVVSDHVVRSTLTAQALIRDGLLHFKLAIAALGQVGSEGVTLHEALHARNWTEAYYISTNRLGRLLLEAGCLTNEQLADATEICFASGLPLLRVLVLRKAISELTAYQALNAQQMIDSNHWNKHQAILAVQQTLVMPNSIQGWLSHHRELLETRGTTIRLGELLSISGIVGELDLLSAVELSWSQKTLAGQIMIRENMLSQPLLEQALALQQEVNRGQISPAEASEKLADFHRRAASEDSGDGSSASAPPELMQSLGVTSMEELRELLQAVSMQKENLAHRLISDQEELRHRLARDLHDTIIADLLMLKRYLSGDKNLSKEQTIEILDDIVRQLREICNDFAPKQLRDWGLKTTLQDLCERVARRNGMECQFKCDCDLGKLPEAVQLHVFRIIQECLNNIEKYANASRLRLDISKASDALVFSVIDNGKGKEPDQGLLSSEIVGKPTTPLSSHSDSFASGLASGLSASDKGVASGGRGQHNIKERVELITCYMPATISFEIDSEKGTRMLLALKF
jgi:signal transduction histidine kinase